RFVVFPARRHGNVLASIENDFGIARIAMLDRKHLEQQELGAARQRAAWLENQFRKRLGPIRERLLQKIGDRAGVIVDCRRLSPLRRAKRKSVCRVPRVERAERAHRRYAETAAEIEMLDLDPELRANRLQKRDRIASGAS